MSEQDNEINETVNDTPKRFLERLNDLQNELNAPKSKYNKFGDYHYRSLEDILEAVKPLLIKHELALFISDTITQVSDRFYVCADATIKDIHSSESTTSYGYAREALSKRGMDESQLTGSCSSYARKYALNALLLIDDVKDADASKPSEVEEEKKSELLITPSQVKIIHELYPEERIKKMLAYYKVDAVEKLTLQQASAAITKAKKGTK